MKKSIKHLVFDIKDENKINTAINAGFVISHYFEKLSFYCKDVVAGAKSIETDTVNIMAVMVKESQEWGN